jgi:hypothetical protein
MKQTGTITNLARTANIMRTAIAMSCANVGITAMNTGYMGMKTVTNVIAWNL